MKWKAFFLEFLNNIFFGLNSLSGYSAHSGPSKFNLFPNDDKPTNDAS